MPTESPPVILIVEDDPGIAELEKDRLTEAGYEILVASSADEAIIHLRASRVQLILLDYRLPGAENGLDFYARVKAAGFDVPVILVTGFGNEATVIQALRTGVRDFVTKSVEYLDYLPDAVERVLRQVRTEHRLAESEARLAAVIGSAKDAVIVAEADRVVSLFNPAAERMFLCPAAEAIGRKITDFIPDELAPAGDAPDGSEAVTMSQRLRAGTRGVRASGEEFPLEASVSRGQANGRRFYTVVVRDMTERVLAEAALRASERRFRAVFDQAAVGMVLAAPDETLILANTGFARLLGRSPDEIPGLSIAAVTHPDDRDLHRPLQAEIRAGLRASLAVEKRYVRGDGSVVWASVTASAIRSPSGEIEYWIAIIQDVTERHRAEERIKEQAALLDMAHDAIKVTDLGGHIRYWNRGAKRAYGWAADEAIGRDVENLLYRNHPEEWRGAFRRVIAEGEWTGELRQVTRTGKEVVAHCGWSLVRNPAGEPTGVLMICTDVTERKRLEEQFRQAQKMEAVGQLAGGVAHDFNNLLTIISGYSEMVLAGLSPGDPNRELIEEIYKAGERAALLTRQLLTFSRKEVVEPRVLDLNAVVEGACRMLRRLIGEDVRLATAPAPALDRVRADPGQVEQVLVNLAVNARDAMPTGGRLTVETANVELDEGYARGHAGVAPGRYVLLAVSDTGVGMTEEVKARIFEPFFTTKGPGKGTGLGLATVFGIVRQSGGHVGVYTEPGRGTTFKVYFPSVGRAASDEGAAGARPLPTGSETVLVVEDDDAVRRMTRFALEALGYAVLEARGGEDALRVCAAHAGPLDLLVTDVVMPGMSGREVAEAVTRLRPGVKVLFVSGYTDDAVVRHGVLRAAAAFLQKPFTTVSLGEKIRSVLGRE